MLFFSVDVLDVQTGDLILKNQHICITRRRKTSLLMSYIARMYQIYTILCNSTCVFFLSCV